jgi:hypothetical protein
VIDFSVSNFLVAPQTPGLVDPPYTRYSNLLTPRDGRRTNGEFQIGPVPPGTYDLIAYWTEPTTQRTLIGKGMFQIVGSDVTGVSASIQPGATLSGEIRVQSTGADIRPETLSLTLESLGTVPTEFVTQPNPIAIDASGKFRGTNIPEERYALHLGPLPPTAYIEDIRIGDRSVFDDGYYLANGTGDVQILIRPEGQLVSGTVRKADGIPADTATVVLVPAVEKRKNAARYRAVHTDSNGVFRMLDVPPGEYTAYAWESVLPTAWMNAKFLEKHKERGRALTVTTGVAVELQMAVIPDVN